MHVQLRPIAYVVLYAEIGIVGVWTWRVLSSFSTYLEWCHFLIVEDFEWRMGEVLGLQWQVRHDISIVDHPYNFGQSGFDKHGQLLISKARTSECMQLANRLVFHLYFQGACHGQCCSQAGSNHQNLLSFVYFLQRIYPCVNLLADG